MKFISINRVIFSLFFFFTLSYATGDVILQPPKKEPRVIRSTATNPTHTVLVSTPILAPAITHVAFREGEILNFVIKYEFVGAGRASMTVNEGPLINNRRTLRIESKAESNKFIDKFFKVRDVNSSVIDKETLVSYVFHQNLREGGYHVIRNTTLDYENKTYQFERTKKGKTTQDSGSIDQPLQDILSAFFYTRTLPLELGQDYAITVFSDKDVYSLKIKVYPKIEDIKVPAGRFRCVRVEPNLVGDAIFKAKEGKMTIWLTNDEYHMPVLLRSKVFIGAFDAELTDFVRGN